MLGVPGESPANRAVFVSQKRFDAFALISGGNSDPARRSLSRELPESSKSIPTVSDND